jgi:hypothetical protein
MAVSSVSHHSARITSRGLWLWTLELPEGPTLLLETIAGLCERDRRFQAGQDWLAGSRGRSRRTIIRWVKALETRGLIHVIRRRKKLTNIYRLARWLWARLKGRPAWKPAFQDQGELLEQIQRAMTAGLRSGRLQRE